MDLNFWAVYHLLRDLSGQAPLPQTFNKPRQVVFKMLLFCISSFAFLTTNWKSFFDFEKEPQFDVLENQPRDPI